MKKFFIKKTGEEVALGDYVNLNFEDDSAFGESKINWQCKLTPDVVEILKAYDIIEEREIDVMKPSLPVEDLKNSDIINAIMLSNEKMDKRLDSIQKDLKFLMSILKVRRSNGKKNSECNSD